MAKHKPKNPKKFGVKLHQGQVGFRLLCNLVAGCAIIGRGGSTSKKIVSETEISTIHVDDMLHGTQERTVYIVGPSKLDRTLVFDGGDGERNLYEVSAMQEVLVRVLDVVEGERVVEVVESERCVRLLSDKGDEIVKKLGDGVCGGAFVRVLPIEELSLCADLSDDLIQKKEVQNSPALRVFVRSLEAVSESGNASGFGEGKSVTARLLVPLSQASRLSVEDAAGVEVQILE